MEFEIDLIFKTQDTLSLIRKPNKESWRKIAEELIECDLETHAMNISRKRKTIWEMNNAPNQDEDPSSDVPGPRKHIPRNRKEPETEPGRDRQ